MKKLILIIDDELLIRKTMTYHLQKAGYETVEADTGKGAIKLLSTHDIKLIICDIKLPDISGIDLIKQIKCNNKFLSIIVISGYFNEEIIYNIKQNGASEYIEKPFQKEKLLFSINKLLMEENLQEARKL